MSRRTMNRLFKGGLLALLVAWALAASAQAQNFTPAGTAVSGTAVKPTLTYGSATIVCDTGTISGTTKNPASTSMDFSMTFSGNCNISGLSATVTCSGTMRWTASGSATSFSVDLNSGYTCTVSVSGVCNLDIEGPQSGGGTGTLNEATTSTTVTVSWKVTRTGSSLCGPASGSGTWTKSYTETPPIYAIA